jgi:deoxyribodipyrimidine photo-lyase
MHKYACERICKRIFDKIAIRDMKRTTLWWIRRDCRLEDNQALQAAPAAGETIVPVFILDPALLSSGYVGDKRTAFLLGSLRELDKGLRQRGSYLVIRHGKPLEELTALAGESKAGRIFAERDLSPYARQRDACIVEHLPLELVDGVSLHLPDLVHRADGSPYTVYTPSKRRWLELAVPGPESLIPAPGHIPTPPGIDSLPIPDRPILPGTVPFRPGEKGAQRRLEAFVRSDVEAPISRYAERRDRMDIEGTSGLSPYLRFGMISIRQVILAALEAQSSPGAAVWLNELIWREFYISILYHFPQVLRQSFRPAYDGIAWRNREDHFAAWCHGERGYPVVDAAMRQLVRSGWMHNRARMFVASFLIKDLLIDWRWSERYFMQHLVDGDPAANNGGWQWTAGTGTDAAPYFRIFNSVLQGKKFDPRGDYVREWLPELAWIPDKYVHEPWKMSQTLQQDVQCVIGRDYPAPIVDHARARLATLDAYTQARERYSNGG